MPSRTPAPIYANKEAPSHSPPSRPSPVSAARPYTATPRCGPSSTSTEEHPTHRWLLSPMSSQPLEPQSHPSPTPSAITTDNSAAYATETINRPLHQTPHDQPDNAGTI